MNLFEIDNAIMECVDMETGEIVDEEKLNELEMARTEKIENIVLWIKNLKAEAVALKAEKDAFAVRQKAAENKAASLSEYVSRALNGNKFETAKCKISFRLSEVLEIEEGAVVPEEYLRYKEPEINKAELKKQVKAGLEIKGVSLVTKQNIQIK